MKVAVSVFQCELISEDDCMRGIIPTNTNIRLLSSLCHHRGVDLEILDMDIFDIDYLFNDCICASII